MDYDWWLRELQGCDIAILKLLDDGSGSCINLARQARHEFDIMPVVRLWRDRPNPGTLRQQALDTVDRYVQGGITKWFEPNNEPNLPDEWQQGQWPDSLAENARQVMLDWMVDAERIINRGGYPGFPSLAECGLHAECSSIRWYNAAFDFLANQHYDRAKAIFENGAWLAVHDAVLNHLWTEEDEWHFEYPYDPRWPKTVETDDNSLIGHQLPVKRLWEKFGLTVPVMSTEGGVFYVEGMAWDSRYPAVTEWNHAVWTTKMYEWLARYQARYPWYYGMMPWLAADVLWGHPVSPWAEQCWWQVGRTLQVVGELKQYPQMMHATPLPPGSYGEEIGDTTPIPPIPPIPPAPLPPEYDGFERPPGDNGLGIHFGLEQRLVGSELATDITRAQGMGLSWGVIAFAAGEDVMLAAARTMWDAGIMPIVRKVLTRIGGQYDFARDTRMLVEAGIPAYVQIFNEPSDDREWNDNRPPDYKEKWAGWWIQKAREVASAGGHPGLQCLHPDELQTVMNFLPADDPLWRQMWFCSHNYGLNHPPDFEEDYWGVLGFEVFARMFEQHLGGYVPPIICGEGGWLYKAYDDHRFPMVDDTLHAQYHVEMFNWFKSGVLSNGSPLPDYLFATCPWILADFSDEAWYGFTERTLTIDGVTAMSDFVRAGGGMEELLKKYNLIVEPFTGPSGFRLVGLTERCEAANCDVWVEDINGNPLTEHPVRWGWPDGAVWQNTGPDGKTGFGMAHSAYYNPSEGEHGPHWTYVGDGRSDELRGIGMIAGTVHCTVNPTFRYIEESPDDPLKVILPLAEDMLGAIPVPSDWAFPSMASSHGANYQVGGYQQVDIKGELWAFQTFTNDDQSRYGVAYAPEGKWHLTDWAWIPRD
jgi:hypothetical protein